MHMRDDGDSDCYVSFTENGASVIEHKIEDPSNLWPDGARAFMKREPQLALLRQLLNTQNQVLKLACPVRNAAAPPNSMVCGRGMRHREFERARAGLWTETFVVPAQSMGGSLQYLTAPLRFTD